MSKSLSIILLIFERDFPALVGKVEGLGDGDGHLLSHLPLGAEEGVALAGLIIGGGDEGEDVVVVGVSGAVGYLINGRLQQHLLGHAVLHTYALQGHMKTH